MLGAEAPIPHPPGFYCHRVQKNTVAFFAFHVRCWLAGWAPRSAYAAAISGTDLFVLLLFRFRVPLPDVMRDMCGKTVQSVRVVLDCRCELHLQCNTCEMYRDAKVINGTLTHCKQLFSNI